MTARIADLLLHATLARAPVLTTRDLAEAADVSIDSAARALRALAAKDIVVPVVRGIWARPTHPQFSAYAVVPFLLGASALAGGRDLAEPGYVSLLSALNLHGLIDQIPRAIHVVVGSQRTGLHTQVGDFIFHRLQPHLVTGFAPGGRLANFNLATPTKALFDTLYVSTRRGRRYRYLPELELPRTVSDREMREYLALIDGVSVRAAVSDRWQQMRARLRPPRKRTTSPAHAIDA
ncbi:MAG: hypothetical protein V4617_04400 [Gemmatimonadota bacterium]